ncbi:GumC family protein [Cognatishimia activa]|uniref:Exopolysaccharide transport protein family protein n=1 Tax=Cognatishimia activa TaxID=1715691 RepID=A0A0P1IUJ7_9RHOB|nr:GumC family protein [Cognatishimia activa]CUI51441.1 exopolysaccharide transport protein family protein [Cognatishimia activa]CUK27331.1 exopolysaccharide transport protein family protein [Cognatishimia activa]
MTVIGSAGNQGNVRSRSEVAERDEWRSYADIEGGEARDVFLSLWRRKWHILACGFFLGLAMFSISARQTELYTAEATMILDPRTHHFVAAQSRVVEDLELSNAVVESAVAVLRAKQTMQSVVDVIGLDAFENTWFEGRSYGVAGALLDRGKALISSDRRLDDVTVVTSDTLRQRHVVVSLLQGTHVERLGKSYVIRLSVTTADPVISAHVANQLLAEYIDRDVRQRRQVAEAAAGWLITQVEQRRAELLAQEAEIQRFQRAWLAADGRTDAVLEQQVAELNREQAIVRAETVAEAARLKRLEETLLEGGAIAVAETQNSALFLDLRARSQALKNDAERLAISAGENHPDRLKLLTDLKLVAQDMSAEVGHLIESHRAEVAVLVEREASLARDIDALEVLRVDAAQSRLELSQLEAERDIVKANYVELSSRLNTVQAQADIQRAKARVLTAAQMPTGPSAPRPKLIGFFGLCIGTSLGFILVLAFEAMGSGFNASRELERVTGAPVLAHLPALPTRAMLGDVFWDRDGRNRLLKDRLRRLCIRLGASSDGGCHTVLLCGFHAGSVRNEVNLAISDLLQSENLRVCILEIDGIEEAPLRPERVWLNDTAEFATHDRLDLAGEDKTAPPIDQRIRALKEEHDVLLVVASDLTKVIAAWIDEIDEVVLTVQYRRTHRRALIHVLDTLAEIGPMPISFLFSAVPERFDPGY